LSVRTGATSAASAAGVTAISEALNAAFLVPEPSTLLLLALALVRIGV
jgi:mevalonate pyrophosphate decarboxylase